MGRISSDDALLIVDVQRDFCDGGSLPVPRGDTVVPVLNEWLGEAGEAGALIVASRDWHPPGHVSFQPQGGDWPPHCIQGTPGAEFHPELRLPNDALIVDKGSVGNEDSYSAFAQTGLTEQLRERGVKRLWIGGLAQDVCVRATVLDARQAGFEVHVIRRATLPVDVHAEAEVWQQMKEAGRGLKTTQRTENKAMPPRDADDPTRSALFTDLYELTMSRAYDAEAMREPAAFELFFRRLPRTRKYVVAAGLEHVLEYLQDFRFSESDLEYLSRSNDFPKSFLDRLRELRFTGDVDAVPEGTVVFPNEPIARVVAPILEAQLVETFVLNQIHFQSVVATKASRVVAAAAGRAVVDFGSRRAHGADAALKVARATYLVGGAGTSNVLAGKLYDIPTFGTMAHSYIQAHQDESAAFAAFANLFPQTTLLVDTYDTLRGVRKVVELSEQLGGKFSVRAVRLDSGDLASLARRARQLLDEAGLRQVQIFASSSLDEYKIRDLLEQKAPIDGFGVGTNLAVSDDAPSLDMAYKLVEYTGRPRMKLSSGKKLYPGRKQVFRNLQDGRMCHDVVAREDEQLPGKPLLRPVMRGGDLLPDALPTLAQARTHARRQFDQLPAALQVAAVSLARHEVRISERLEQDRRRLVEILQAEP